MLNDDFNFFIYSPRTDAITVFAVWLGHPNIKATFGTRLLLCQPAYIGIILGGVKRAQNNFCRITSEQSHYLLQKDIQICSFMATKVYPLEGVVELFQGFQGVCCQVGVPKANIPEGRQLVFHQSFRLLLLIASDWITRTLSLSRFIMLRYLPMFYPMLHCVSRISLKGLLSLLICSNTLSSTSECHISIACIWGNARKIHRSRFTYILLLFICARPIHRDQAGYTRITVSCQYFDRRRHYLTIPGDIVS